MKPKTPVGLENPVQLAVIGAAHGIKGEVRVKAFTEDPMALGSYGPLYAADGRSFIVAGIRPAKEVVIVRFKGVDDRNGAEALNGEALFVDRSVLPEELEEDEFYYSDLIGLTVVDETDEDLGRVIAVHNFGAGDLLEFRQESGSTLMIPFTRDAVPEIDFSEGMVRIDSMAAGLDGADAAPEEETSDRSRHRGSRPRGPKAAGGNR
ncbi:ribosome maturation factor RimM [Chelativorans sp. AA-79]|uniref:ribosome maturation factor RimM n=1 Tax=Chelativorans sp. AA-79 TaxID=3028735 RepID=UPI0023F80024|nr:ribosome maturation factor RimM [Chelativorans sp. AA-79]WEX09772.1 ribosome maturation factor RimM [Chelativorans sp. AA-79]